MLTKLLCKWFKLISQLKMKEMLSDMLFKMAYTQNTLKIKYKNKEISEWLYYKKLWKLHGRLEMIEDIIDKLR